MGMWEGWRRGRVVGGIGILAALGGVLSSCAEPATAPSDRPAGPDRHLLSVWPDRDGDWIGDFAEACCPLLDPEEADRDRNGRRDGVDLAGALTRWLEELPDRDAATPGSPCKFEHDFVGTEYCRVCGEEMPRGVLCVVNPLTEQEIALPYMALHFLRCGSLVYAGSSHSGEVELCALLETLRDGHWVTVAGDGDGDYLTDEEERRLGLDPQDADQDRSWRADGVEVARTLGGWVRALPVGEREDAAYRVFREGGGSGWLRCPVCRQAFRVGRGWEVCDPLSRSVFFLGQRDLHFLEHGSLGGDSADRVDAAGLARALGLEARRGPAASRCDLLAPSHRTPKREPPRVSA